MLQMDLYDHGIYRETEIPIVVVPVDRAVCKVVPPPPPNNTIDFSPLVTTCDVMFYVAEQAEFAAYSVNSTLACSVSLPPDCDQVTCRALSNNDSLSFRVLPCHAPPAIQLVNRFSNDTLRLNHTFTNTSMGFVAYVGTNPATLNVTIVQHPQMLTLGVGVSHLF